MKDIFKNSEFENFLYGGIKDLEEPVGRLVYNLYKNGIITDWSCSGHIGKFIQGSEKNAIEGNYAYDCGRLHYKEGNNKSLILTAKLKEITLINSFAVVKKIKDKSVEFILDMEDIAIHCDVKGYASSQVPIEKAKARYNQFLEIWGSLAKWSSSPSFTD